MTAYSGNSSSAVAAISNAVKASGPIIQVEPDDFVTLLAQNRNALVIKSPSGVFVKNKYMTNHKGFFFYTKTRDPLVLPASVEIISAKKIWVPEM